MAHSPKNGALTQSSRWLALTVFGALGLCAAGAEAQGRMPPIPADAMTEAQRQAVAAFRAERGVGLTGPFIPLLRSPELLTRTSSLGQYLRYRSVLPPRLSEFVILMTARQWSQSYVWALHQPIAIAAGVAEDVARAIAEGRRPDRMSDDEAMLYDFCDELGRTQGVSDATYRRTEDRFGAQGVIDTTGIVGYYTMLAMVLNVSRAPAGPGPTLPSLP